MTFFVAIIMTCISEFAPNAVATNPQKKQWPVYYHMTAHIKCLMPFAHCH